MVYPQTERHLLKARDLADLRYAEQIDVRMMAGAAGLSRSHFSREFTAAFGESPRAYLLTRRLERAAALLSATDYSVAEICMSVGLSSVGSFTSSFKRIYGVTPTGYRAARPPASQWAQIPSCVMADHARRANRTFGEDTPATAG